MKLCQNSRDDNCNLYFHSLDDAATNSSVKYATIKKRVFTDDKKNDVCRKIDGYDGYKGYKQNFKEQICKKIEKLSVFAF